MPSAAHPQYPHDEKCGASASPASETAAPSWDDERVRILDRLAHKLLDTRLIDERERLINELARQEAEIQHLRETTAEQAKKLDEQATLLRNQSNASHQYSSKLSALENTHQESKRASDLIIANLKQHLIDAGVAKEEQRRRSLHDLEQLKTEKNNAASREIPPEVSAELERLRASEFSLKARLENALSERQPTKCSDTTANDEVTIEEVADEGRYRGLAAGSLSSSAPVPDEF